MYVTHLYQFLNFFAVFKMLHFSAVILVLQTTYLQSALFLHIKLCLMQLNFQNIEICFLLFNPTRFDEFYINCQVLQIGDRPGIPIGLADSALSGTQKYVKVLIKSYISIYF